VTCKLKKKSNIIVSLPNAFLFNYINVVSNGLVIWICDVIHGFVFVSMQLLTSCLHFNTIRQREIRNNEDKHNEVSIKSLNFAIEHNMAKWLNCTVTNLLL